MTDVAALRESLDGEVFNPDSPGYEEVRRPVNPNYADAHPQLLIGCRSTSDVVRALGHARATGMRIVPRGGGHCFAGRSSTDGIVLDLAPMDAIVVDDDGVATVGAGARLAQVYSALHEHGRTIPAGCGATVGIAGLTLGGGIGLLGRTHGLTCDRLVGARVVLADGRVLDCDRDHEPDLFWALRGAGGGQFGVVTSLRFETVEEPMSIRFEGLWPDTEPEDVVAAWQEWAPDAPAGITANLSVVAEPGRPIEVALLGASLLGETATRDVLDEFSAAAGVARVSDVHSPQPYSALKDALARQDPGEDGAVGLRIRSEFFSRSMRSSTIASLLAELQDDASVARRQLNFTAMGGAYNRVAEDATAFAHRDERFLLEHIEAAPGAWVDRSWAIAHADGSGGVYPNFPDPRLGDWSTAYHGGNHDRLAAIKRDYDPERFFDFPQAV
ncbi:FAD-binding oxidoreductase [Agromyces sp. H66]|uniref:FAD-binding oxidoreductase n=1 Tax=Agromyces sp. H66 TaxID=2529859 RepID=UPI0010A9BD6B|nr:FAD-binding oxidoreductase [Agromyces sp. H66]